MLERVILVMVAMPTMLEVKVGKIQFFQPSRPETGSHFNVMENSKISIMPAQKAGIETPSRETLVHRWSRMVFCLTAEMIPRVIPTTAEMRILRNASFAVVGKRSISSSITGRFVWYDVPRSNSVTTPFT